MSRILRKIKAKIRVFVKMYYVDVDSFFINKESELKSQETFIKIIQAHIILC